jgi:predicted transcriptional regulator
MTITITPEVEARLREKALRDGQDVSIIANTLLAEALAWEAQDYAEAVEGIRRGIEASDAGRVRPFAEFAAEMRAKYNLPTHLADEEIHAAK